MFGIVHLNQVTTCFHSYFERIFIKLRSVLFSPVCFRELLGQLLTCFHTNTVTLPSAMLCSLFVSTSLTSILKPMM